jgi:ABC-type branched-subunit amino acid transport system substrate-binding protein
MRRLLMKTEKTASILCCLLFLLLPGCHNEPETVEQAVEEEETNKIHIGLAWVRGDGLFIEGAELAVAEANASGGVLGKIVKLIINQDESEAVDTLSRTSSLMAGENIKEHSRRVARFFIHHPRKITAVIGHQYSFMAFSAAHLYQQSRILFLAPTAADDLLTGMNFDYVFRMLPKNSVLGKQLASYSAAKKFKRVAVFNERSEYAVELSTAFKQSVSRHGIRTVQQHSFFSSMSVQEFSAYAVEFKRQHKKEPVDAVFLFVSMDLAEKIIQEFYKRGVGNVPFITGQSLDRESFWDAVRSWREKIKEPIQIAAPTLFNERSDAVRYFVEKFEHTYEQPPDSLAALGYDSINTLLAAVEQAGSPASDKVVDELRYMRPCQGLMRKIAFQDNGDIAYKPYMMKWLTPTGFEYRDLRDQPITPDTYTAGLPGCVRNDRDQDGVVDRRDICPDNIKNELVNGVFLEGGQLGCPQDTDSDGVPDYRDLSPEDTSEAVAEGVDAQGDPLDSDKDGVPNYRDKSPDDLPEAVALGVDKKGIPKDTDLDSVPDYLDLCRRNSPSELGEGVTAEGCPLDTDKDGVQDFQDACPDNNQSEVKAGIALTGCPVDRDKDGVPDYWDKCPDNTAQELRFGVERDGCPQDSDKDNHPDYRDACRLDTAADLARGVDDQGCPEDSDQDGVYDVHDRCPGTNKTMRSKGVDKAGCPLDTDQDNVPDYLDKCPSSIPNVQVDRHGCAVVISVTFPADNSFESGDTVLSAASGISKTRIDARGMGEQQPVASNVTAEGRARNRRFELNVYIKVRTP